MANVIWQPQAKQIRFLQRREYEVLYGGAAGGGKSDALLVEALRQVHIPHYRGILFRKTYPQLSELIDRPDMLDSLWTDRPAIPHSSVEWLDEKSVGETRKEKFAWLRGEMQKAGCSAMFLTSLDEIAWLLNVRGQDIDFNPYVISNLLVTPQRAVWFVRNVEEVPAVKDVSAAGYTVLEDALEECHEECGRLFADPSTLKS